MKCSLQRNNEKLLINMAYENDASTQSGFDMFHCGESALNRRSAYGHRVQQSTS